MYIYKSFYELYELNQTVLFLFPNLSKISPPESTCAIYSKFL